MSDKLKYQIVMLSGILGFIIFAGFALMVYVSHIPQSIATWGMILILDALGLILAYRSGNKKPYLQLGWTIAAFFMFFAVMMNGSQANFGWVEIISIILCGIAIILWITMSARAGLWAYMAAMYISLVPLIVDYWNNPQPNMFWLWILFIVPCILAILGAEKRDFANTFVPWGAIVLDAFVAVLCII